VRGGCTKTSFSITWLGQRNQSGQSSFGQTTFLASQFHISCECTYMQHACTIVQQLFSLIMASGSSCSRNDQEESHINPSSSKKNERHEGSFLCQSELAASRMLCTKLSLSANSHVLSTLRVRRSRKPQSSGSEARKCHESPSRQLQKWRWNKFSALCVDFISTTHKCIHTHKHTNTPWSIYIHMYTHMQSHMHTLVQQTCYYSSSVIATDSYKRRQSGCDVQVQFYESWISVPSAPVPQCCDHC